MAPLSLSSMVTVAVMDLSVGVICFQDIGPVANWNVVKYLGALTGSNSV